MLVRHACTGRASACSGGPRSRRKRPSARRSVFAVQLFEAWSSTTCCVGSRATPHTPAGVQTSASLQDVLRSSDRLWVEDVGQVGRGCGRHVACERAAPGEHEAFGRGEHRTEEVRAIRRARLDWVGLTDE